MTVKRLYMFKEIDSEGVSHPDQEKLFSTAPRLKGKDNKGVGMCLAIICDWAKTSLQYRGVTLRAQMNPGRWPIIQSAYQMGLRDDDQFSRARKAIEASGLTVLNNGGKGISFEAGQYSAAIDKLKKVTGHFIFCVNAQGGHAMGFRQEAGLIEFVDPDTGHWQADKEGFDEIFEVTIPIRIDSFFESTATVFLYEVGLT